jgi:hypothetical protein
VRGISEALGVLISSLLGYFVVSTLRAFWILQLTKPANGDRSASMYERT